MDYSSIMSELFDREVKATRSSWDEPFQGKSHILWVKMLNEMNRARKKSARLLYSNYTSVAQSSGTGKSRTAHEVAGLLFTLPFNLRESRRDGGYPLADEETRDFLSYDGLTENNLTFRYIRFFGNLFRQVSNVLHSLGSFQSYEDLATAWRVYTDEADHRATLYAKAEEGIPFSHPTRDLYTDTELEDARKNAQEAATQLLEDIGKKCGGLVDIGDICLLLVFDESQLLSYKVIQDQGHRRTYYQVLCSVLKIFAELDIFTILLSKKPGLAIYNPHSTPPESDHRFDVSGHPLQAPIIELPFDRTDMPYLAKENALSVDDVCSVEFMARFGRMLWWTRWKHGDSLVRQGLISFAVEKLNCNHPKVLTENGQLSALNVRLLLDFAPRRQIAVDKQIELVADHMLIVHCIPDFLEGMRTSAPSEPILAEAAARIMTNMSHIPQYLLKQVGDGLVSSDDGGNLVARLLLTLAHDQAVQAYQAAKASRAPSAYSPVVRPLYTEAILLVDFLKALISDNWLKLILDSYPTNIAPSDALRKPFREMFKDALINFTHFVRTGDGSLVRDEGAWLAFVRGMGVQWSYNKPTVNIFLPLLLRDEKIGRHVMSGLFIQVENGRHSEPECAHVDAETLNFFSMNPSGQADNRPYVCITMNLGPRSTEKLGPNGQQRPPNVRTDESYNSSHPRYAFTIFGCSSSVYEVIMPNEKNIYAYLRVPQSLMGEYPYREDVDRNAAMLRMKPVWVAGTSSYEWSGAEPDAGPSGLEAQSEQTVGFEGVEVEVWDGLEG